MNEPNAKRRNPWILTVLVLWGFAPTILAIAVVLSNSFGGEQTMALFVYGSPLILWSWGIAVLWWQGKRLGEAVLGGIPLAFLMGVANVVVGAAGCALVAGVLYG